MKKLQITGLLLLVVLLVGFLSGCPQKAAVKSPADQKKDIAQKNLSKASYASLGERIFLTGKDATGKTVQSTVAQVLPVTTTSVVGCANCHGKDAKGQNLYGKVKSPELTGAKFKKEFKDLKTLKDAVVNDKDPDGKEMSPNMPRWQMNDANVKAVFDYLQTLK